MDNKSKAERTAAEAREAARLDYFQQYAKEVEEERGRQLGGLLDYYAGQCEKDVKQARRKHPWKFLWAWIRRLFRFGH
jgi:hypothetical protein